MLFSLRLAARAGPRASDGKPVTCLGQSRVTAQFRGPAAELEWPRPAARVRAGLGPPASAARGRAVEARAEFGWPEPCTVTVTVTVTVQRLQVGPGPSSGRSGPARH